MGFLDEHCLFQELTDEKIAASKPFYCGNNDLDEFFHEDVTKFSYNLMGKSYCFILEKTHLSLSVLSQYQTTAYVFMTFRVVGATT